MNSESVTHLFLKVWALALLAYAVFAICFLPSEATVSHVVSKLCRDNPELTLLIGLVVGHIVWVMK